ncbi:preprotein translocase subunit SecA [Desulfitibacter alkalitolerans]|uniref:preprotein translocase subunit SecA n=1 Tax=Desulfitibacter alkalitolerans TaxID=264641 RepID=UPI000AE1C9A0|nr:preprotein translocase subunit SecA [Desulfitibacter alkalitolerans]
MLGFIKNLLDDNSKQIKKMQKTVDIINHLETDIKKLGDSELRSKTEEFKSRIDNGEGLDTILPEAFAVVREASWRVLKMRHFDVQLMGGIVLHQGKISEMKTGEGKTLVATLPAYLNALTDKGVHVVTVNDYLARRDSEWMGEVYKFLGLSVGLIVHGLDAQQRRAAYNSDITYGTNNEFGFDYLRDNMAISIDHLVQRELNYAIVDEVDSILIDEARTPLIISGQADKPTQLYYTIARLIPRLKKTEDYIVDEKARVVTLTEEGTERVEQMLGIENLADNMEVSHHVNQGLRAHALMKRDRDYVVKEGQVVIVDEFTGRLMFGRRYSEGLHQAIEAKEGVKIENESQTLASITFQNYFRMYNKLAGMTGTAATEEPEFVKIYKLSVVEIPTNKPMIREDNSDKIYRTEMGKFEAVVEEIVERNAKGQPVLVGTISIEKSELISQMLSRKGVAHEVLNAKHHEREAEIIANAGQKKAVTIATNMAGRGTDIVLGDGVKDLGGLHIIGTERHESRRIDNQLRGRAGRQGDPGSSRFYVSMEDDLMRLFGSDSLGGIMDKLGMDDSTPIDHPLISKSIENAQKKVESRNFDIRKHVLEYDDVLNHQREVIYSERLKALKGEKVHETILGMIESVVDKTIDMYAAGSPYPEEWDLKSLIDYSEQLFLVNNKLTAEELARLEKDELREMFQELALENYKKREEEIGPELFKDIEKYVLLKVVDQKWMDHLDSMDQLRQGIGLRAYGQQDPLVAYRKEGHFMFTQMVDSIEDDVVRYIYRINVVKQSEQPRQVSENKYAEDTVQKPVRVEKKISRNDPCPCGSGKKYKKCCGQ